AWVHAKSRRQRLRFGHCSYAHPTKELKPKQMNNWQGIIAGMTVAAAVVSGVSCFGWPTAADAQPNKPETETTVAVVGKLPPPSTAGLPKSISALASATSAIAPKTIIGQGPFRPSRMLKVGSRGEAVLALEKRLAELRYDVAAVDGRYDLQTWQGVVAVSEVRQIETHRHIHVGNTEGFACSSAS
ncbi:MAG: peptidoglycan-binding domain-containing protein, partial [Gammaproteobacteria bacterium]